MEDKDKKKNVKKLIVYAVLLALIMGIALGPDRFRQRNLGGYLRSMQLQSVNYCF